MPDKNPFAPSSALSFLTGLGVSTMDAFKKEHDRTQKEDQDRKEMDYQLLMDALKTRIQTGNITPGEINEILTRGVDIFKPKGHQDIKDKLGELFGHHTPYEMQGGQILGSTKPKVDVGTVEGGTQPSVFSGDVTLPAPPDMPYRTQEPTLREQDQRERMDTIEAQTDRQLAVEERRAANRLAQRREQNQAIIERFKEEQGIKDDASATKKLRERASFYGDPDDPANQERARISLQEELNVKKEYSQSRVEINRKRLGQIDANIKNAEARINIAKGRLGATKAANWDKDPQVKGAWAKVQQYKGQAQTLRTQAAIKYSQGDTEGAAALEQRAEESEQVMQGVINEIEKRVGYLNGNVKLPSPPARGPRKAGTKFTREEILAQPGATEATVERARQRGLLAP